MPATSGSGVTSVATFGPSTWQDDSTRPARRWPTAGKTPRRGGHIGTSSPMSPTGRRTNSSTGTCWWSPTGVRVRPCCRGYSTASTAWWCEARTATCSDTCTRWSPTSESMLVTALPGPQTRRGSKPRDGGRPHPRPATTARPRNAARQRRRQSSGACGRFQGDSLF